MYLKRSAGFVKFNSLNSYILTTPLLLYHSDKLPHNFLTRFLEEEVMETLYQIIAKNVLVLRNKSGLSQLELATSAEIALKTLHAIEHAHANCRLSTLNKIAAALDVPVAHLLGEGTGSPGLDSLADLLFKSCK